MTNDDITRLVLISACTIGFATFVWLILIPVMSAYSRVWEKAAAAFLSLYVLAALVGLGVLAGGAFVYFYDRF